MCVRVCVRACVRACVRVGVHYILILNVVVRKGIPLDIQIHIVYCLCYGNRIDACSKSKNSDGAIRI